MRSSLLLFSFIFFFLLFCFVLCVSVYVSVDSKGIHFIGDEDETLIAYGIELNEWKHFGRYAAYQCQWIIIILFIKDFIAEILFRTVKTILFIVVPCVGLWLLWLMFMFHNKAYDVIHNALCAWIVMCCKIRTKKKNHKEIVERELRGSKQIARKCSQPST